MLAMAANSRVISFAEIVKGRDSSVRVTSDGLIYAVDLVMVVTGKNCNHSNECLRDLEPSLFDRENFIIRSRARLLTFQHAIELIMVLPGKLAKETRTQFGEIIKRYIAGDPTLVKEIAANAVSDHPINQLARSAMEMEELEYNKKRKREIEDLEILERRLVLEKGQVDLENSKVALEQSKVNLNMLKVKAPVDFIINCMTTIETMCGGLEARDKLRYKALLNISASSQVQGACNDSVDEALSQERIPTPTSISDIVSGMKVQGLKSSDYQQIGKIAKKMYMALHGGKVPTQHNQQAPNGQWFKVNDYYLETDEQMLKDAVNRFLDARGPSSSV